MNRYSRSGTGYVPAFQRRFTIVGGGGLDNIVGAPPSAPLDMGPSIVIPLVAAAVGYFATRNKEGVWPWAAAAGLLAGVAINASLRTYQAQVAITKIGGDLGSGPFNPPTYGGQVVSLLAAQPVKVEWSPNLIYSAAIDKQTKDAELALRGA